MSAVLLIDIGNTSTTIGLGKGQRVVHRTRLDSSCGHRKAEGELKRVVLGSDIEGVVLCSVVPSVNSYWTEIAKKFCAARPLVVTHRLELGVSIDYPKPASIGADRLANACGAAERYGAPVIVADFGTALTFDIVSPDRAYVGGIIAPGLPFMTDYLAEKTELLPHIQLKGRVGAVGKGTEEAMRIGAKYGYRGMVREIVNHVKDGMGVRRVKLCATGGYARWALDGLDMSFHFDSDLTLYGLAVIWQLNNRV